jgi:DNA-binding IclR family transcriptional regulator
VAAASFKMVAAVHVHGPSYRFPPKGSETGLADQVVTAAARISGNLREAG